VGASSEGSALVSWTLAIRRQTRENGSSAQWIARGLFAELHVAPQGHEIGEIVGEQVQPLGVVPLVEQRGFLVEKLFDLFAQPVVLEGLRKNGGHLARTLVRQHK
jgi:hypothetical protein